MWDHLGPPLNVQDTLYFQTPKFPQTRESRYCLNAMPRTYSIENEFPYGSFPNHPLEAWHQLTSCITKFINHNWYMSLRHGNQIIALWALQAKQHKLLIVDTKIPS